jgi:hypothetical protein
LAPQVWVGLPASSSLVPGLQPQIEHLAAGAVQAWLQQRRDLELVGEAELADVAHGGLGPEPGRQAGKPEDPDQP